MAEAQSIWEAARWSPYLCGAGVGVVTFLAYLAADKAVGASSAYATLAGLIEKAVRRKEPQRAYYREHPPKLNWSLVFVIGILVGAFVSAGISGDFRLELVPPLWREAFGPGGLPRLLTALVGGAVLGFGARLAGGCTSGHGISGALQLQTASWLAALCFLIGGVATAAVVYP